MDNLLKIGELIKWDGKWWEVGAIMFIGERYYVLHDEHGTQFLLPAKSIEGLQFIEGK